MVMQVNNRWCSYSAGIVNVFPLRIKIVRLKMLHSKGVGHVGHFGNPCVGYELRKACASDLELKRYYKFRFVHTMTNARNNISVGSANETQTVRCRTGYQSSRTGKSSGRSPNISRPYSLLEILIEFRI